MKPKWIAVIAVYALAAVSIALINRYPGLVVFWGGLVWLLVIVHALRIGRA